MNYKTDFAKHFEIIYEKFCSSMQELQVDLREIHPTAMAKWLGVSRGQMQSWQRGQWPSVEALAAIAVKLGFSYRWLVTGDGDPFGDDAPEAETPLVPADPDQVGRLATLEAELRAREKELLQAKNEIIALQRKLLERH